MDDITDIGYIEAAGREIGWGQYIGAASAEFAKCAVAFLLFRSAA